MTPAGPVSITGPQPADRWARVVGYLIDVLPTLVIGPLALIPIAGVILVGLIVAPYWLLRDIAGASLGKLVLGMRVVQRDGTEASLVARVLRNLPIAIPAALLAVPFLGYLLAPSCGSIIVLIEGISLLSQGERIGDRLAGTMVILTRKRDTPAAAQGVTG